MVVRVRSLITGELRMGFIIGLTLGVLIFITVWLIFADVHLALAVSLALLLAGAAAASVGFLFPLMFFRLGQDPGLRQWPACHYFQNVLTLTVYYFTVSLIVL